MRLTSLYIASLIAFALVGCATSPSAEFTPLQGKTGVVISRDDSRNRYFVAPAPQIILDGRVLGSLGKEGSLSADLAPGEHNLHTKGNFLIETSASDLNFTVQPGQITHVSAHWGEVGGTHYSPEGYGASSIAISAPNKGWVMQVVD